MRILVFGKTGQVAQELQGRAGREHELICLGRAEADLTDAAALRAAIASHDADAIINAAAYTAVDQAESEPDLAHAINGAAPGVMAEEAAARGVPFVHISTDYVFDGSGQAPWAVSDKTAPLGVYGASKLEGERRVVAAGGQYAILRTSWVVSAHGKNFVKTMLRLGRERERLSIVADQIGGPTPAADIAVATLTMAEVFGAGHGTSGIYHFSGAPEASWADFAREIFRQAGLATEVVDIATSAYPTPAARPLNSRLDCSALTEVYGIPRPDWQAGLTAILKDLGEVQ